MHASTLSSHGTLHQVLTFIKSGAGVKRRLHLRSHEIGRVIQDELTRRNRSLIINGIVDLDQTTSLLYDRIQGIAVIGVQRNTFCSRFEQGAWGIPNFPL